MPASRNQNQGRSTGISNALEIILLILIGSMIFILAYQAVTLGERSYTIRFSHIKTSGEQFKLVFGNR